MYWHTTFGDIGVEEAIFYDLKRQERIRPFSLFSGVSCRGYSAPLQRAITDFGADDPFQVTNAKLKEHYGITVPVASARKITEHHADVMADQASVALRTRVPKTKGKEVIIAEIDGSMIPLVEFAEPAESKVDLLTGEKWDKRRHKSHRYGEARLSLAVAPGSVTPVFAGTLDTVEVAGAQLLQCVEQVGCDAHTKVHCVGDGAPWIALQVEEQFGANGTYLIDFYHLCEYVSAAAKACSPGQEKAWVDVQKALLKNSDSETVLLNLKPFVEAETIPEEEAPVRACYRYIKNRPSQLDYKKAKENDLPIGSGAIESAHRYVIQHRLKIAGSWWRKDKASSMLALRIRRANHQWEDYWQKKAA